MPSSGTGAEQGVAYLTVHRQIMVRGGERQATSHLALEILDTAGLQRTTQVDVDFDPSYELLTLHFIRIRRGDEVSDRLDPARINVVQREEELEGRIYDGTRTAIQFLDDLRVGDVLEYAYTITGSNPVFDGHFFSRFPTAFGIPVDRLRYRLLIKDGREISVRNHGCDLTPARQMTDAGVEWAWDLHDIGAIEHEDAIPDWYDPWPWVQVTDFRSWAEIVQWARPLYEPPGNDRSAFADTVARCRAAGNPEDQTLCAVRFVQDEVRYLGLEVGPNSHQPHDPAVVLGQRFGDCKDKSLLLVVLLRELGLDARPALVNTEAGRSLDSWLPTPSAFDHVIVRLTQPEGNKDEPVWIDATQSFQGGRLSTLVNPPFERALVIGGDVAAFETMPTPQVSEEHVSDRYTVLSDGSATFEVETAWTAGAADFQRGDLADTTRFELQRHYCNYYAKTFPGIESTGEIEIRDDRDTNRLVMVERYHISDFWNPGERTVYATLIDDVAAEAPHVRQRRHPLALDHPVHLKHEIHVDLPFRPDLEPARKAISAAGFRFEANRRIQGRTVAAEFSYRSMADSVPPGEVQSHLAALGEVRRQLGVPLVKRAPGQLGGAGVPPEVQRAATVVGIGVGLVVLVTGVRVGRNALRRMRFRSRSKTRVGEAPDRPLEVLSELAARHRFKGPRCGCVGGVGEVVQDRVILNGATVHVLAQRCNACGVEVRLYYRPPTKIPPPG